MAGFRHIEGPGRKRYWRKVASTAIAVGECLASDGAGAVTPAADTTVSTFGISMKKVASADSDYASNTRIPVIEAGPDDIFEMPVLTGTATVALEGLRRDLHSGGEGINVNGTSHNQVTITKFISATLVLGRFNSSNQFYNAA